MTSVELLELVTVDRAICHGQRCIKGTRALVTVVLDALAAGLTAEGSFSNIRPSLTRGYARRLSMAHC